MQTTYFIEMLGRDWVLEQMTNFSRTGEELLELARFDKECTDIWGDDWTDNIMTLVNEEVFDDYAEELFFDIYTVPDDIARYIDTKGFAHDLKYDYSSVSLWDSTFWGQS